MKPREIKFRQWMSRNKHWHYFEFKDGMCSGVISASLSENPIMQFTGLLDKNGNEIYEGDIIAWSDDERITVQWNDRLASFGLEKKGWAFTHFFQEAGKSENCKIIGNIHQTPDLI